VACLVAAPKFFEGSVIELMCSCLLGKDELGACWHALSGINEGLHISWVCNNIGFTGRKSS